MNSFTIFASLNVKNGNGVVGFAGVVFDDLQINFLFKLFPLDGVVADLVDVAKK